MAPSLSSSLLLQPSRSISSTSSFDTLNYGELKALATQYGLLARPVNRRLLTREYLSELLVVSGSQDSF